MVLSRSFFLGTTLQSYLTGTGQFQDAEGSEQLQDGLELRLIPGHLDHQAAGAYIHHFGPENLGDLDQFALAGAVGLHLDECQFAAYRAFMGQVRHLDHVDQFVQLFTHLLDHALVPIDHNGHARHTRILGRSHRQAIDVETAPGEEPGHPGQDSGVIGHHDRESVPQVLTSSSWSSYPRPRTASLSPSDHPAGNGKRWPGQIGG